ncbi:MAG: glycine cleavage system aminomethyltransferase GcvT [Desulfurococcales archaeon]|nr:glycine cleavage system aminomethyltransferase GcvT [Desulfurococcales archaeon]
MPITVPLLDLQRKYGGNPGEFAGWITSMDYGNPIEEHVKTRTEVTIFDVSHMGRYVIRGSRVIEFLQKLVSKDISKVSRYFMSGPALLLTEEGGIRDDIMLYYVDDYVWFAVVNAPNIRKDLEWLNVWKQRLGYHDVEIEDVTLSSVLIAIQGPRAPEILEGLGIGDAKDLKILQFIYRPEILGKTAVLISKSGWTGEEVRSYGFEIWTDIEHGKVIFEKAIELGAKPAGLIARDSLRLEMGYLLAGVDMNENTNPIEARYWLALSLSKAGCIGCDRVREIYEKGVSRIRVGLRLKKGLRVIPRHGCKIKACGEVVGEVTSGAFSPTLNRPIAMGYVKTSHMYLGGKLTIEIRGREYEAKLVDFPFI